MRNLVFRLLVTTLFAVLVSPTSGAEIRDARPEELRYTGYAEIILEGKVETGDYDKLLRKIDEWCDMQVKGVPSCASGIYLASPGGNLIEAMKIGRLVRKLRLETHVPSEMTPIPSGLPPESRQQGEALLKARKDYKAILKDAKANYMCASACFFIFVAGVDRERDIWPPVLAIHRPYLSEDDLKSFGGNQVMASAAQLRILVENYLKEMGVPTKYADLMFSIPKDQVRFINDDDFKADFEGYIPELQDWLDAKCNKLTDVEKAVQKSISAKTRRKEKLTEDDERFNGMLLPKTIQEGECRWQALSKFRADAWKQFHAQ